MHTPIQEWIKIKAEATDSIVFASGIQKLQMQCLNEFGQYVETEIIMYIPACCTCSFFIINRNAV